MVRTQEHGVVGEKLGGRDGIRWLWGVCKGNRSDFLVFFDHDLLNNPLEDYGFSGIEDCVGAGGVVVGVI